MSSLTGVACDLSHASTTALEWAVARARRVHGALELVAVLDDVLTADGAELVPADAVAALEDVVEAVRTTHPGVRVSGRVVHGFVIPALARETAMDRLLVIGTAPRRAPRLGSGWSYGARVATVAHGPVAIVPNSRVARRSGVVVGVDGSPASWAAVLFAAEEAERTAQPLRIVHGGEDRGGAEVARVRLADHERTIRDVARRLRDARPTATARPELVLSSAPPARALLHGEPAPALVVIGSRGVTGWSRLLVGSVGHDVLAALDVPVVVACPAARQRATPARGSSRAAAGLGARS